MITRICSLLNGNRLCRYVDALEAGLRALVIHLFLLLVLGREGYSCGEYDDGELARQEFDDESASFSLVTTGEDSGVFAEELGMMGATTDVGRKEVEDTRAALLGEYANSLLVSMQ